MSAFCAAHIPQNHAVPIVSARCPSRQGRQARLARRAARLRYASKDPRTAARGSATRDCAFPIAADCAIAARGPRARAQSTGNCALCIARGAPSRREPANWRLPSRQHTGRAAHKHSLGLAYQASSPSSQLHFPFWSRIFLSQRKSQKDQILNFFRNSQNFDTCSTWFTLTHWQASSSSLP